MRILVLGGTRFIGRAVVDALLAEDRNEVTVLNRGTHPLWDRRIGQLLADRNEARQVEAAIRTLPAIDVVVDISGTEPAHLDGVPDSGTIRYVFISSAAVYDRERAEPPFTEADPSHGDAIWGRYGSDKAACEKWLQRRYSGRLTVLRPPYVYGPRNTEPREQFLWGRMLAGQPILIPRDGSTAIQFCEAGVVGAVVRAACAGRLDTGTYNIAEPRSYTFAEYLDILGAVAGCESRLEQVQDPAVPAREYFPFRDAELTLDVSRLLGTGALPDVRLQDGLTRTFDWFRHNS